jgi:hypothetical protein
LKAPCPIHRAMRHALSLTLGERCRSAARDNHREMA